MLKENIKSKIDISKTFYKKHERFIPLISFFAGFTWDSFTLTRIDELMDSLILLFYFIMLGLAIVIMFFVDKGIIKKNFLIKYSEWYPAVIQFLLGGLFSTYVVFYFQSASFTKTSLFFIIILGLFYSK